MLFVQNLLVHNLEASSGVAQIPTWNVKWGSARNQCNFVNSFSIQLAFLYFNKLGEVDLIRTKTTLRENLC